MSECHPSAPQTSCGSCLTLSGHPHWPPNRRPLQTSVRRWSRSLRLMRWRLKARALHGISAIPRPASLRAPGRVPAGCLNDSLSEALDLGRTLCALAGVDPDPGFEGRALLRDPAPEAIFSVVGQGAAGTRASSASDIGTWPDGRGWPRRACLRTHRYRFDMNVRQDGGPVLQENEDNFMTDSLRDPAERHNIAADPAQADHVAAFRNTLLERAASALEPSFVPRYTAEEVGAFAPPAPAPRRST